MTSFAQLTHDGGRGGRDDYVEDGRSKFQDAGHASRAPSPARTTTIDPGDHPMHCSGQGASQVQAQGCKCVQGASGSHERNHAILAMLE
jgi:hypothetical protein